MPKDKRSFFERLTGTVRVDHDDDFEEEETAVQPRSKDVRRITARDEAPARAPERPASQNDWIEEAAEEGQLTVDVYQTASDIVIKTIVAGLRPDELDISISRDMVVIRGKREESHEAADDDFFHRELYWGSFSRTILLPEEVDTEAAEAVEKHGLLTIRLPKIDKRRQMKLKVKSN